jgi:DNA-binding GntR family transcriptional regulator
MGEGPAPLYARVKQMITQQIDNGSWPPHHRVPSESELVSELGFSRMTINRALRELTAEGLLVRMQGVGTFVAEPKSRRRCSRSTTSPTKSPPVATAQLPGDHPGRRGRRLRARPGPGHA